MNRIYTYYFTVVFVILFLLTYPLQLIFIQKKEWHKYGHKLNKYLIKAVFFICFIKVEIENKSIIKEDSIYIFCANHSSYIDILAMYLLSNSYFRYLGKSSLEKIPLFGYMYKKLYITVNRRDKQSRGSAFTRCQESINEGVGIAIYPEGAIPPTTPKLIHFKDGAFRLSIDNNIPLVPITMPFNHKVLPVGDIFRSRLIKIIVHPPLNTSNHPYESVRELKDVTYSIIENELNKHLIIA